jgi:hypothetical protein
MQMSHGGGSTSMRHTSDSTSTPLSLSQAFEESALKFTNTTIETHEDEPDDSETSGSVDGSSMGGCVSGVEVQEEGSTAGTNSN